MVDGFRSQQSRQSNRWNRGAHAVHIDAILLPLEIRTEAQRDTLLWLPQWEGQDNDIMAPVILPLTKIHDSMR